MSIKLKDTIYDLINSSIKLETSRKLWGQSFNGTGDVSGNIENAAGGIYLHNTNEINSFNGALYLNHRGTNNPHGEKTTGSIVALAHGGSFLIGTGTNTGATTLYVAGTIGSSGSITSSSFIKSGSSNSYILLGGGNHKAVSDFSLSGHTHSQYLTALPSHNHDSSYVSALGVSGNYVTWTKNGSTNNITVPYATSASYLSTSDTSQAAASCFSDAKGLHFYRYNGDETSGNGGDGFILQWSWGSGSVGGQIYLDDNPSQTMMIRGRNNDADRTFTNWAKFLHSGNYTSYTVTKTGSGASGTWGISISGNAATATTASSASVATIARSLGTDDTMKLYANHNNEVNFGGTFKDNTSIFFGYRATDSKAIPTSFVFGSSTGTATVTAKGFIMKDSSNSYVLLGGGGHKAVSDFATSGHTHSEYAASSHTHSYLPLAGGTMTGAIKVSETLGLVFRHTNTSYTAGLGYDTAGNECFAIWAKNTVTRLRWNAGVDMSSTTYNQMMSITPDFEVSKASGSAIGYIAGNTILTSANYGSYCAAASHTHNYAGSGSAGGPAYNLYDYNDSSYTIRCGFAGTGLTASTCSYLVGISANGKTISYKDISAAEARSFIGAAASSHSHAYLPTAGGDMSSGARISASGGNLLLGNSNNTGWVQTQDICSQSATGDTYWSIRQNGTANFTILKIGGEQITFTT